MCVCVCIVTGKIDGVPLHQLKWGSSRDGVANVQDREIVVSMFEFLSRYFIHFRTNNLEKGMKPFTTNPQAMD